ncbi:MAG: SDR family oxidoreductase [Chitinivibrionales bacterium]
MSKQEKGFPPQHQNHQPGRRDQMDPMPVTDDTSYKAAGKLKGKNAIITGADSGIGRAVAIAYAKEGANISVVYLEEHEDARETAEIVQNYGGKALLIAGDVGDQHFCGEVVNRSLAEFGSLDILVNNAGEQHAYEKFEDISALQLERTFRTNLFSMFYMTQAALPHLRQGAAIINTTSITAYQGHPVLLGYAATKGGITSLTRSLALHLADRGIRVNGVAPGPVWTPLIPASYDETHVSDFGTSTPMGRAGQPYEIAPSYVFLACDDSSYITGQVIHPNGGRIVNT